jgi:hypothetical protein
MWDPLVILSPPFFPPPAHPSPLPAIPPPLSPSATLSAPFFSAYAGAAWWPTWPRDPAPASPSAILWRHRGPSSRVVEQRSRVARAILPATAGGEPLLPPSQWRRPASPSAILWRHRGTSSPVMEQRNRVARAVLPATAGGEPLLPPSLPATVSLLLQSAGRCRGSPSSVRRPRLLPGGAASSARDGGLEGGLGTEEQAAPRVRPPAAMADPPTRPYVPNEVEHARPWATMPLAPSSPHWIRAELNLGRGQLRWRLACLSSSVAMASRVGPRRHRDEQQQSRRHEAKQRQPWRAGRAGRAGWSRGRVLKYK